METKALQCIQSLPDGRAVFVDAQSVDNRDSKRDQHLLQISRGLDQYFAVRNDYPSRLNDLVPHYMSSLPNDPKTFLPYEYTRTENEYGIFYEICANFETRGKECLPAG